MMRKAIVSLVLFVAATALLRLSVTVLGLVDGETPRGADSSLHTPLPRL